MGKMKKIIIFLAILVFTGGIPSSCKISYSFTGANISPAVKTFSVYYFTNRSKLINPTLSQSYTEALREKIQRQTSLDEVQENGDLVYEGYIDGYEVRPMAIQAEDLAAQNRLTITVVLKYTNNVEPEQNVEQTFRAFEDFDANLSLADIEDSLVPEIIEKLNEDIFNATIANW